MDRFARALFWGFAAIVTACAALAAIAVTWRFLTWLDFAGLGT